MKRNYIEVISIMALLFALLSFLPGQAGEAMSGRAAREDGLPVPVRAVEEVNVSCRAECNGEERVDGAATCRQNGDRGRAGAESLHPLLPSLFIIKN